MGWAGNGECGAQVAALQGGRSSLSVGSGIMFFRRDLKTYYANLPGVSIEEGFCNLEARP